VKGRVEKRKDEEERRRGKVEKEREEEGREGDLTGNVVNKGTYAVYYE
jgi:hypothetical protein